MKSPARYSRLLYQLKSAAVSPHAYHISLTISKSCFSDVGALLSDDWMASAWVHFPAQRDNLKACCIPVFVALPSLQMVLPVSDPLQKRYYIMQPKRRKLEIDHVKWKWSAWFACSKDSPITGMSISSLHCKAVLSLSDMRIPIRSPLFFCSFCESSALHLSTKCCMKASSSYSIHSDCHKFFERVACMH